MPDWLAIKTEFVTGSMSQRALAEKYGISQTSLNARARREGWEEARRSFSLKAAQETAKKVSEALAESEADISKTKASTRLKLWRLVERTVDKFTDETDSAAVRRCVQNYCDLLKSEADVMQNEETEDSGLIAALNAACDGLWQDGDDSNFLPTQEG